MDDSTDRVPGLDKLMEGGISQNRAGLSVGTDWEGPRGNFCEDVTILYLGSNGCTQLSKLMEWFS